MTFQGDPYRTLGLAPGASVNEIRSAYRRLAKRYHPDAAGERAVPRFLAIQAAYEALVDANGNLRRGSRGTTPGPTRGPAPGPASPGERWQADPARARASREAWRARGRPGTPHGSGSPGAPPGGERDDPGTAAGGRHHRPGGNPEHHYRRHRRTATPGSTTYDEAAETPLDPEWDGGTWYGASSGTYWTLNPREYADPRKHGPEYRRRAWRAAGQRGPAGAFGPAAQGPWDAPDPDRPGPAPGPMPRPASGPTQGADGADGADGGGSGGSATRDDASDTASPPDTENARNIGASQLVERVLARAARDAGSRAVVAAVAAVPVPLAAGVVLAGLAGCGAGGCPPLVGLVAFVAWVVAALVLVATPAIAALGAFAVLVAGFGALVSGVAVATVDGDLGGSVLRAAGSLGLVLYCFSLVIGGAVLYGRRERPAPSP